MLTSLDSGQKLTITAEGTFGEKITKGAYVNLEVKYGIITLLKQTADLCEQLENVQMKCPLDEGKMVLTKEIDLPKQIPPVRSNNPAYINCKRLTYTRARTLSWLMSTPLMTTKSPALRRTESPSRLASNFSASLCYTFTLHICLAYTYQVVFFNMGTINTPRLF